MRLINKVIAEFKLPTPNQLKRKEKNKFSKGAIVFPADKEKKEIERIVNIFMVVLEKAVRDGKLKSDGIIFSQELEAKGLHINELTKEQLAAINRILNKRNWKAAALCDEFDVHRDGTYYMETWTLEITPLERSAKKRKCIIHHFNGAGDILNNNGLT